MKPILLLIIRVYWSTAGFWRPRCRFWPTCSHYAYEAVEVLGPARGLWLGFQRLLRCRPFGRHGYDPIPLSPQPYE